MGTDPTGLIAEGNYQGASSGANNSTDLLLGGLDPEDRNLISGNIQGGSSPNTGSDNWVYQGNYIGVGKDGLTAIPNATAGASGAISLDNSNGHIVGGSQPGAINVISGNFSHGVAPHNTDDVLVEGNYIGVGYDGVTPVVTPGADGTGITFSASDGGVIRNNIVANTSATQLTTGGGIFVGSDSENIEVLSNTVYNNEGFGIYVQDGRNIKIGDIDQGNFVYGNGHSNIGIFAFSAGTYVTNNVTVQGNSIGFDTDGTVSNPEAKGVLVYGDPTNILVGGTGDGEGNTIKGAKGAGVMVASISVTAYSLVVAPQRASVLGNSITDTGVSSLEDSSLGIDLAVGIENDNPPNGLFDAYTNLGPNLNDSNDPDTGPNGFINFPVLNSAEQTGTSLALNYDLDAAGSPSSEYRVEFFANDAADASGYGEGQTFLGAVTASNGSGNTATLTLPNGLDLTGKVLSATTTAIDNTTDSGFGSTSEFSAVLAAEIVSTETSPSSGAGTNGSANSNGGSLAKTGQNTLGAILAGIFLISSALVTALMRSKYVYRLRSK